MTWPNANNVNVKIKFGALREVIEHYLSLTVVLFLNFKQH